MADVTRNGRRGDERRLSGAGEVATLFALLPSESFLILSAPSSMTRYPLAVAVLAVTLAPLPARPQPAPNGEWRDDVDRFAQSLVDAQVVPGMGIAVTQSDRVVYSRGFGLADAAT